MCHATYYPKFVCLFIIILKERRKDKLSEYEEFVAI
jgi:hypothetical protein